MDEELEEEATDIDLTIVGRQMEQEEGGGKREERGRRRGVRQYFFSLYCGDSKTFSPVKTKNTFIQSQVDVCVSHLKFQIMELL